MQDPIVKAAVKAVDEVFGDTSVSRYRTRQRLEHIQSEIETRLGSLPEDELDFGDEPDEDED